MVEDKETMLQEQHREARQGNRHLQTN